MNKFAYLFQQEKEKKKAEEEAKTKVEAEAKTEIETEVDAEAETEILEIKKIQKDDLPK